MNLPPAPTVLIVGFLGAGKTTFIQQLLPLLASRGLAPYVLINDYRNAEVDASSLRALTGEVRAINGDCICCDSLDELINSLLDIHDRPRRVVLVEANGTSDPFSLIEHLSLMPKLRERFDPLLQVTVVDAKRWQRRAWHDELERMQTETASHFVLSHQEAAGAAHSKEVRGDLEWANSKAKFTDAEAFADLLASLVDGTRMALSAALPPKHEHASERDHAHEHSHDHGHSEDHGHDHKHERPHRHALAHGFIACQIDLPPVITGASLLHWLRSLPPAILRVKGVAQLQEFPGKHFVFQRTDDAPTAPVMKPVAYTPTVDPCAVLIGVSLNLEELRRDAEAVFSKQKIGLAG
jgi:G3E family GTPase